MHRDFLNLAEPPTASASLYGHLPPNEALAASLDLSSIVSPMRLRLLVLVSTYPGLPSRDHCRLTRRTLGAIQRDLDTLRRHGLVRGVAVSRKSFTRILWSVSSTGGALLNLLYGPALAAMQELTVKRIDWLLGADNVGGSSNPPTMDANAGTMESIGCDDQPQRR